MTNTYIEELYIKLQHYNADISISNYFYFQESNATFYKHVFEHWEKEYDSKYLLEHYFDIQCGDFSYPQLGGNCIKNIYLSTYVSQKG